MKFSSSASLPKHLANRAVLGVWTNEFPSVNAEGVEGVIFRETELWFELKNTFAPCNVKLVSYS